MKGDFAKIVNGYHKKPRRLVEVTLELMESGKRAFKVQVRWQRRPTNASHVYVRPEEMTTTEAVKQRILLAAGAMAEKHCEEYQDTLSPDEAVRLCSEALKECLMDEAQRTGCFSKH